MQPLTSYERVYNTLHRKPVDQVPAYDSPWAETIVRWRQAGWLGAEEDPRDALDMDIRLDGWLENIANLDAGKQVLEETAETVLVLDGNGAKLRHHKLHDTTPEHVDFTVHDRRGWEELIKPHLLQVDRRRFPLDSYRNTRCRCADRQLFFAWLGIAPFEQMHPVCGHEHLLMGMLDDPDWVREMVMTFARFTIMHLETLFAEGGMPDAVWFAEDMGFKGKPFISPSLYREILQPGHKLLFDWAHGLGLKVILHSCGFIEPLVGDLIASGVDCLQALEVKAGMDMRRLQQQHGDALAYFGNMDARVLTTNDPAQIAAEIDAKLPVILRNGGRYLLMSDHSLPPQIDFPTMRHFFAHGRAVSREILARA